MPRDGALAVGASVLAGRYDWHGEHAADPHAVIAQYASIGFLPFVEVGLRLTRQADVPRQALGDRMFSVRVRLLEERPRVPAIVFGAHDLIGTRVYHATYVVGSKHVEAVPVAGRVGLHLGYGGNWTSLPAHGHEFHGVFGGVSASPRTWVELLGEYDAEHVNAGVRLHLWRVNLLAAAENLDGLSAGVSYTHPLK